MSRTGSLLVSISILLQICIHLSAAMDATSFFKYIKEHSEVEPIQSNGREARQFSINTTNGNFFQFAVALNGISNFSFPVNTINTNFPIACGGDDRNYCNYPDLPLIETYDLSYYAKRPIPSGRCPDGYTKLPTFDCLNIAPALFETTCCAFMDTVPNICNCGTPIDALFTLCNGSLYITSGAYAWRYDQNFQFQQGPILLSQLTGGGVTRDLAEAETLGGCQLQSFNMMDQFFLTDFTTSPPTTTGPFLVTSAGLTGTPQLAFQTGRGLNVFKVDGDGFQISLGTDGFLIQCAGNVSAGAPITVPQGIQNFQNCSAATYLQALDLIVFICPGTCNNVFFVQRNGQNATTTSNNGIALNSLLSNCGTQVGNAPLVYIPYPIYPVFTGNQQQSYGNSYGGGSSYGSAPAQSYGAAPAQSYGAAPAQSYGASPSYGSAPAQSYGSAPSSSYGK